MKVNELISVLKECPQTSIVYAAPSDDIRDGGLFIQNVLIDISKIKSSKDTIINKEVLIVYEN